MGLRFMAEGRGPELARLQPALMGLLVRAFVGRPAGDLYPAGEETENPHKFLNESF
jgi:hypothetical protein